VSTVFLIVGAVGIATGIGVFALWRWRGRVIGLPLAGTILLAAGVLALVTGWLLTEPSPNRGEALKTGGLAAGAVVALYALWLNDRRRRVDEERQAIEHSRQELERARTDHDRERVADERFARAVEMLGDDADQVRVGALHALAGLARSRAAYTQTVLDVFCSYLRRPFDHPTYADLRGEEWTGDREPADRERQVRITAQRLIRDLLPLTSDVDTPCHDLDLTGATLEYFDIAERAVGELVLRVARLYESNAVWGVRVRGDAWFTGARSIGRLHAHHVDFGGRAWFSRFEATQWVDFSATRFRGGTKWANAVFTGPVSFADAEFDMPPDFTATRFDAATDAADVAPEHHSPEAP